MISLAFGLIAALAWGIHDFCVRFVSQRNDVLILFLAVLVIGCLWFLPVAIHAGGWSDLTPRALGFAVLSGFGYVLGGLGLYRAFAIGPVRIVAPITGSYPVLYVAWAALGGQPVPIGQWIAVFAVIGGIAAVAAMGHGGHHTTETELADRRWPAILWATAGSVGFALTFVFGHIAAKSAPAIPVILIAHAVTAMVVLPIVLVARRPLRLHRAHLPILIAMGFLDMAASALVIAAGRLPHPEYAAVASSVFGVVTILLAWRFLREPVSPGQWAGIAVVFAGIAYLGV